MFRNEGKYEFPHIALNEFFAGRTFEKNLFSPDAEVKRKAEEMLKTEKSNEQCGLIFSFAAGRLAEKGSKGIVGMLTLLRSSEIEVAGLQCLRLKIDIVHQSP